MEDLIHQIIADDEETPWPEATPREIVLPWLPRKADALIGMRRAGKTWMMRQRMRELVAAGVPRRALLYMSFEDERLWELDASNLRVVVDVFYRRHPELRKRECAFFFDEIQVVPGWERFVRRIIDSENVHICISGSSARLLSREIATSMRGRSIATEIFPFSFREVLTHRRISVDPSRRPGKSLRSELEHAFHDYIVRGGFPEVQDVTERYRVRVLQEYLDAVILRDVVERHHESNVVALRRLIRQLINSPASLLSVHRLYNDFRSQGINVSKDKLYEFQNHLEDAFLAFRVPIHTDSERVRQSNPQKCYPIDPGLVTACSVTPGLGTGQLLETCVFLHLRRQTQDIAYYRHRDGTKVDFVVEGAGTRRLVQVSADISSQDTRKRELRALEAAMKRFGLREATIVTMTAEESIEMAAGRVRVVPAPLWLLE
jgi:uncharacterized protein